MPSVCLLATLCKNYWTDLHENFTAEELIIVWKSSATGTKSKNFFWRILQHCKIGHFSTSWLISLESDRIFMKILSQMYPCTSQSLLNFGSNPECISRPYSPWRTYAASDCSCLRCKHCESIHTSFLCLCCSAWSELSWNYTRHDNESVWVACL